MLIDSRQFVSFGGKCSFNCLHCYTFSCGYQINTINDINDIINNLQHKSFNIVYVSGHRENFINPDDGIALCERVYEKYDTDILITTRNIFNRDQLKRISKLNQYMKKNKKTMFFCVSIPAYSSYRKLEPNQLIPNPDMRIEFLKSIFNEGIFTMLTIRPLCPSEFIPIDEPIEILNKCSNYSTVVISSGIIVNKTILERLKYFPTTFKYDNDLLMKCLNNDLSMQYVNVEFELEILEKECNKHNVPFFQHSLPAIDYIKNCVQKPFAFRT